VHRSTLTSRRFEESIHQLTTESIEEALKEIEEALQKRYGQHPVEPEKRPA
jgi:predicted RNase H-like HicB family nuclease